MASHALIYLLAYAAPGLMGFFSFGIYTRVLMPEEYAVYSIGVSISFLIGNVLYGWLRFALGRYQSESPSLNFQPFILACFSVITLILIPTLAAVGIFYLPNLSTLAIAAILFMTAAQALFEIMQETRRARHESSSFALFSVGRSVTSFSFGTTGAILFQSGSAVVTGIGIGFFALALISLFDLRKREGDERVGLDAVRRFTRYGLPLSLSGLVFSGNSTLARLIVSTMLGAAAAGHFGAAMDITNQLTGIIASAVAAILGPTAIRAYKSAGPAAAQKELTLGVELFLAAMVPAIVGLMLVARSFGEVVAGRAFETEVGLLLPCLAASRGLNAFAQFYLHLGFQIVERPMRQVICGATTLVVNVAASVVLIRYYGLFGAAYGILIGDLVGVVASILLLKAVFPMPIPLQSIGAVGLCAAAMTAVCLPVDAALRSHAPFALVGTIVAGGLTYAAMAYILDLSQLRTRMVRVALQRARRIGRRDV